MTTSKRLVKNLTRWDFVASALVSVLFALILFESDKPFVDASAIIGVSIALGVTLALGAAVAGRWLGDGTKDDAFGEVIRALDPTGRNAQGPFRTVVIVGIGTSLWGGFLLLMGEVPGPSLRVCLYALQVFLVCYGLLGMLDVLLLGFRNQARQASLRSLREAEERRRRNT